MPIRKEVREDPGGKNKGKGKTKFEDRKIAHRKKQTCEHSKITNCKVQNQIGVRGNQPAALLPLLTKHYCIVSVLSGL